MRTKEIILKKYCKKLPKRAFRKPIFRELFILAVDFVRRKVAVVSVSYEKNLKFMHLLQKRY